MVDIVGNLPAEVVQKIFLMLSPDDIHNACKCSLKWEKKLDYEFFWKKKCKLDDFNELEESEITDTYTEYIQHFPNYWMGVYMYCRALNSNWMNNKYKEITVTQERKFIAFKHFDNELAMLINIDYEIVILDSSTGTVRTRFKLSDDILLGFRKYNDLVMGHYVQQFAVWNCRSGELLFQRSFTDIILKFIKFYKNFVAFVSSLDEACIIDIETGETVYKRSEIKTLSLDNDMLALAKFGGEIEILNLNFNLIKVLKTESRAEPIEIVIKGDYLINFYRRRYSYLALIWNIRTGEVLRQIESIFYHKSVIFLNNDKMIYSSISEDDGKTYIYCNFVTGEIIATFNNSFYSAFAVANSKLTFMHSFQDSAGGWCLKTGKLKIKNPNMKTDSEFLITEQKLAYFDKNMNLHILDYEHNLQY